MANTKLTKAVIDKLPRPPQGKQTLTWDSEQPGLGLLVSGATGVRALVVQGTLKNGKKRRITLARAEEWFRAGRTMKEARDAAAKQRVEMREGIDPKAKDEAGLTLQDALDDYIARPKGAAASKASCRRCVEDYFRTWLNKPLIEITPEMIETRFHAIQHEVAARTRKRTRPDLFVSEPGAGAANAALRALRGVWNFAGSRSPDLPPWPTARLKGQWHHVGRRERHVRAADLPTFYAAANERDAADEYALGRDMRDIVLLLLFTGFRVREACSLKWRDIDFEADIIRLPAKSTKSKRRLDLPMTDLVRDLLKARRALGVDSEFVFPGRGRSGHIVEPKKAFYALSARCGFAVNPHALRSTFITVAAGCSMPPTTFKALVNHAIDVGDVTGGYVQELDLRKSAQAVARALKQRCGIASPARGNITQSKTKRHARAQ